MLDADGLFVKAMDSVDSTRRISVGLFPLYLMLVAVNAGSLLAGHTSGRSQYCIV